MNARRTITLGAISLFLIGAASSRGLGWSVINAKIRHDFPEVKRITTTELAAWLNDANRVPPLLLDVRTAAEYEVSHLRRARHVPPDAPAAKVARPKDQPIVTYCSVGYRSGAFAERLRLAGYANVMNLEGSIFRWANERRPVYRGSAQVAEVHPYSWTWGLLLKKNYRAAVPSVGATSQSTP